MIDLENFQSGRTHKGVGGYHYFIPNLINDQWTWNSPDINELLEKAAIKLGELNSYSKLVPNIQLFIQLHVTTEAVISSRIEGTQTNLDEALLTEEDVSPERRSDWKEVNNYILALNKAIADLGKVPISSRLIKSTHAILLNSVRGQHKQPGEFRKSQNWIGGTSPADAVFVPPHFELVNDLMGDLENFLHNDAISIPKLIRIAIAHYQFETIHPFLDGNGRIGRLLITLFLVDTKILDQPLLYLSTYFEKNKTLYYDNLTFVRTKNDMKQWLKYFLIGIADTTNRAVETLSEVLELKAQMETMIPQKFGRRSNSATILLNQLFIHPIVHVHDVMKISSLSKKAANDLVSEFINLKILKETTGQTRNRIFVFDRYLECFRK